MNEIIEKTAQTDLENKKDNNPLSVRVDPYYKEVFEELIKQKGIPKKVLLETMISSYVDSGHEGEKEAEISFVNEINLIASNFSEIMNIFKAIAAKSKDTIGSQKIFFEQKIKNLETRAQILETDCNGFEQKNKLLEATNNRLVLEKEKLERTIHDLKEVDVSGEKELSSYIRKNSELLEQLNILHKAEKESVLLKGEIEKVKNEIVILKSSLDDKTNENEKLRKRMAEADETIMEMKNKKAGEFKELESVIRKETDIDKKMEILRLQLQYNELQAENLKNLGIINKLTEEASELRSRLERK